MIRPLLSPWHRRVDLDGGTVFNHGASTVKVSGAAAKQLLPALLPLLDGTRSEEAVVAAMGESVRPAVERALAALRTAGVLVDGPALDCDEPLAATATFLTSFQDRLSPEAVAARLAGLRVAVRGTGATAAATADALAASGIEVSAGATLVEALPDGGFDLLAPAPDELPAVEAWNRQALHERRPWMLVLPFDGLAAFVGPIFVPGETACFECFRIRRGANGGFEEEFWALEQTPLRLVGPPSLDALVGGLASFLLLRWVGVDDSVLLSASCAVGLGLVPSLDRHVLYPVPRCPACADVASQAPLNPWFQ